MYKGAPFRDFKPPEIARKSSVLVLLYEADSGGSRILLTLRSDKLKSHSGQISFPGGKAEPGENDVQTALREANEETGLDPRAIEVVGKLSRLYVPPSNSLITPVVAVADRLEGLEPNMEEVEEIIELPLDYLFDKRFLKSEIKEFGSFKVDVPFWNIHKKTPLWGATAMILKELTLVLPR
ncbi:MAG: NUDIX hydrolase [Candidatus Kapaibacterium sp.]